MNKTEDKEGKSYWINALKSNLYSKSAIVFAITDNLNSKYANQVDKDNFDAKVLISKYFSLKTQGLGSFNKELNSDYLLNQLTNIISNTNSKNLITSKSNLDTLIDTLKHINDIRIPIKLDDTLILNTINGLNAPTTTYNIKTLKANVSSTPVTLDMKDARSVNNLVVKGNLTKDMEHSFTLQDSKEDNNLVLKQIDLSQLKAINGSLTSTLDLTKFINLNALKGSSGTNNITINQDKLGIFKDVDSNDSNDKIILITDENTSNITQTGEINLKGGNNEFILKPKEDSLNNTIVKSIDLSGITASGEGNLISTLDLTKFTNLEIFKGSQGSNNITINVNNLSKFTSFQTDDKDDNLILKLDTDTDIAANYELDLKGGNNIFSLDNPNKNNTTLTSLDLSNIKATGGRLISNLDLSEFKELKTFKGANGNDNIIVDADIVNGFEKIDGGIGKNSLRIIAYTDSSNLNLDNFSTLKIEGYNNNFNLTSSSTLGFDKLENLDISNVNFTLTGITSLKNIQNLNFGETHIGRHENILPDNGKVLLDGVSLGDKTNLKNITINHCMESGFHVGDIFANEFKLANDARIQAPWRNFKIGDIEANKIDINTDVFWENISMGKLTSDDITLQLNYRTINNKDISRGEIDLIAKGGKDFNINLIQGGTSNDIKIYPLNTTENIILDHDSIVSTGTIVSLDLSKLTTYDNLKSIDFGSDSITMENLDLSSHIFKNLTYIKGTEKKDIATIISTPELVEGQILTLVAGLKTPNWNFAYENINNKFQLQESKTDKEASKMINIDFGTEYSRPQNFSEPNKIKVDANIVCRKEIELNDISSKGHTLKDAINKAFKDENSQDNRIYKFLYNNEPYLIVNRETAVTAEHIIDENDTLIHLNGTVKMEIYEYSHQLIAIY